MSYCGHLSASPLQPPSAPSDVYAAAIGVETMRVNVPVRMGKEVSAPQVGPTQYVYVGTNPLGNKGSAMDGCGLWILITDPNPASRS